MSFYSSNELTLNFESLTNQSYPMALEIIFYIGILKSGSLNAVLVCNKFQLTLGGFIKHHHTICLKAT